MIHGIDISSWQDNSSTPQMPDLRKAMDGGNQFIYLRAAYGRDKDRIFDDMRKSAVELGFPWGAYWFYKYNESLDPQLYALATILGNQKGDLPIALDLEKVPDTWGWGWPSRIDLLNTLNKAFAFLDNLYGKPCVLYTNPAVIHYLKPVPEWLLAHPLWVAHYGTTTPDYEPWLKAYAWQYGTPAKGIEWGMESKDVDGDYWMGTENDFNAYLGKETSMTDRAQIFEIGKIGKDWVSNINWDTIMSKYQGIYILSRYDGQDNPNLNSLISTAKEKGMRYGFYMILQDDTKATGTYGKQVDDFLQLIGPKGGALPPAIMVRQSATKSPHSMRGDMVEALQRMLAKYPTSLMMATPATLSYLFTADSFGDVEDFKKTALKFKLWLFHAGTAVTTPFNEFWMETTGGYNLWRIDLCHYYDDLHLTRPEGLKCGDVVTPPPTTGDKWGDQVSALLKELADLFQGRE